MVPNESILPCDFNPDLWKVYEVYEKYRDGNDTENLASSPRVSALVVTRIGTHKVQPLCQVFGVSHSQSDHAFCL